MSGRNLASADASPNGEKESAAYYYQSAPGGSANYPELALLASIQPIAGLQQQQGSSVQTPVQGTCEGIVGKKCARVIRLPGYYAYHNILMKNPEGALAPRENNSIVRIGFRRL